MDKIKKFVENYHSSEFDALPKFMRRRVDALKKLQLEQIKIEHQYHKELRDLELKYEKLYQPIYAKRNEIIKGDHEPSDEECQLPANIVEDEFNGDQENKDEESEIKPILSPEEEISLKDKVKGLPCFWLGCLLSTYNFSESIEDHDKKILTHLKDIKLVYGESGENYTYTLEFEFEDNSYFTNQVLTKTYFLRLKPDEKDPFSYDGFEVCKSEGCKIDWVSGQDPTVKTVSVKQRNKNDGSTRHKKKEVERDSFFLFFKPPQVPAGGEDEIDEELGALMAVDFELGEVIRQSIIPRAPLYYCGYMLDDEDDEDMGPMSDDDDDDDDDDDEDGTGHVHSSDESESDDESAGSDDSLNKDKVKKSPKNAK